MKEILKKLMQEIGKSIISFYHKWKGEAQLIALSLLIYVYADDFVAWLPPTETDTSNTYLMNIFFAIATLPMFLAFVKIVMRLSWRQADEFLETEFEYEWKQNTTPTEKIYISLALFALLLLALVWLAARM